jgi:hypothetical protein
MDVKLHMHCFQQLTIVAACVILIVSDLQPQLFKQPYHTSTLTGEAWVLELLAGHPERIRYELGIHRHVFDQLISKLQVMGHQGSKYVSLEEQLAIFLYSSVTGLTVRHVGEQFQWLSDTISK